MKQTRIILEIILFLCILPLFTPMIAKAEYADGSTLPFRALSIFGIRCDRDARPLRGEKTMPAPAQTNKTIVVKEEVGCGTTRQEALRDAMRKAIAQAVGTYMTTELELKEDDMNENVVVASNAVLSNYEELDSMEEDGVWMIKIRASVRPNEYLKYCPALIAQDISAEIQGIVGSVVGNENLEDKLDEIFDGYPAKLFDIKRTAIKPGANTDLLNDDWVSLDIDYTASINQKEYDKFLNAIRDIVEKNAKYKTTKTENYSKNANPDSWANATGYSTQRLESEIPLDRSAISDCRFIGFETVKQNKITTTYYLVRKELFNLLRERCMIPAAMSNAYMVFSFFMADGSEPYREKNACVVYLVTTQNAVSGGFLNFKDAKDVQYKEGYSNPILFPFKKTVSLKDVPTENVNNMKEMMIYFLNSRSMFDDQRREDSFGNNRNRSTTVFSEEAEKIENKFRGNQSK